eukprot:CAMPEP_0172324770 /NCGR_PEP_ID=MMETSP1058-20130122/52280_1 /TAXON_ID=83371 /ORGANISM="Detonula confervacea, Strain CCMP 353" /LENGTH=61 /DNA_ID=CAMNT_0013041151 /DNA_START=114 /DNA_END=295 /DNA_ORIENTATION=-
MPKKTTVPLSDGGRSSSDVSSEASIPQKYAMSCAVKESHGHPIYCVAFSRHVHVIDEGNSA